MIVSVSRRTDIPALYAPWFYNRLQEGYVMTRNPRNPNQVKRISLAREDVDGFVFWTKNPAPMLPKLELLKDYPYYFQVTLTPYGREVEKNLPSKLHTVLPAMLELADKVGPDRLVWRYDPILLSDTYNMTTLLERFAFYAMRLRGHTRRCVISFVDQYQNTRRNAQILGMKPLFPVDMKVLAMHMSEIAAQHNMEVFTCCEDIDLTFEGVKKGACVDGELLSRIAGRPIPYTKDTGQRPACGCAKSVDIGAYNTCTHGCLYCYANYAPASIRANVLRHDPHSPFRLGNDENA